MAKTENAGDTAAPKARKARSAPKPKKLFIVLQVKDAEGNVIEINKDQVVALAGTYSAEEALEVMESTPSAFYKSFTMKPSRGGGQAEQA